MKKFLARTLMAGIRTPTLRSGALAAKKGDVLKSTTAGGRAHGYSTRRFLSSRDFLVSQDREGHRYVCSSSAWACRDKYMKSASATIRVTGAVDSSIVKALRPGGSFPIGKSSGSIIPAEKSRYSRPCAATTAGSPASTWRPFPRAASRAKATR